MRMISLLLSVLAVSTACSGGGRAHTGFEQDGAWSVLLTHLRSDELLATYPDPAPEFSVRSREPSILPRTSYYWGVYISPIVSHGRATLLGAATGDRVIVIENPEDWVALYDEIAWRPRTDDEAVKLCAEFIGSTRAMRGPFGAVQIVDLDTALSINVIGADQIRSFAAPPNARRSASGWSVDLTMIERGKTLRYRCDLEDASEPSYAVMDSILGYGFAP